MSVLVTGAAGYIGSHTLAELRRRGRKVVALDDLSAGVREAVPDDVPFVQCDVRDRDAVRNAIRTHEVAAVCHFAARIQVGESVADPRRYYNDNLLASIVFVDTVLDEGIRHFVFSSTAAVYGNPDSDAIDEGHAKLPVNPYGEVKLAVERMLAAYDRAYGLRSVILRYFNAAGADPAARLGERHEPETHLIPLAIDAALGRRGPLALFGEDYPTPDGTCIRDYIHVLDLASAHAAGLEYLEAGGATDAFNLGTGRGASVREVIRAVEHATGSGVPVVSSPRRAGDPARLVAKPDRAHARLQWRARHSTLDEIVASAVAFHRDVRGAERR